MKKSVLLILTALAAFAMLAAGCRGPGHDPDPEVIPAVIVTFDKNGGDEDAVPAAIKLADFPPVEGEYYTLSEAGEQLPEEPARVDHTFAGWNTDPYGEGDDFTEDTPVTESVTVYAMWVPGPDVQYTVTFNRNNTDALGSGGATAAIPASISLKPHLKPPNTVGDLPVPPTRSAGWGAGMVFNGWNTKADGTGDAFTGLTPVTGNITVYAKWRFVPGTAKPGEGIVTTLVHDAPRLVSSPTTQGPQGTFNGNVNDDGSVTFRGGAVRYQFPENLVEYDYVKVDYVANRTPSSSPFRVILKRFDTGDDYFPLGAAENSQYPELANSGSIEFAISDSGDSKGLAFQFNTSSQGRATEGTLKISRVTFTTGQRRSITFSPGLGDVSPSRMTYTEGISFPRDLPVPELPGYKFGGWYINKDGVDTFITNSSYKVVQGDLVVRALWIEKATPPVYNVPNFSAPGVTLAVRGSGAGSGATATPITNGFRLDYGSANGYENTWVKFNITLGQDSQGRDVYLSDFDTITFTLEGNRGDITYKDVRVMGGANLGTGTAPITSVNNMIITKPDRVRFVGTAGNRSQDMTFKIDEGATATLKGALELGIYFGSNFEAANTNNGNIVGRTQFTVTDFKLNPRQ